MFDDPTFDSRVRSSAVAVVPCSGMSARGQLTTRMAALVEAAVKQAKTVHLVPLLAGVSEELDTVRTARAIVTIAGCQQRCELATCRQVLARNPDASVHVGDQLPADVREMADIDGPQLDRVAQDGLRELLEVVLAKVTNPSGKK